MNLPDKYLDIHTFFFGDQSLGPRANEAIFRYVHEYIRQTPRFYAWATVTFWCNIYNLNINKDIYNSVCIMYHKSEAVDIKLYFALD